MLRRLTYVSLAGLVACAANAAHAQDRADVNFAFGGASTNTFNALDTFAAQDPNLAAIVGGIRASGLDIIGVTQQLDFATATINDVDPETDLFWVYAGTNNFLGADWVSFLLSGGAGPLPMNPAQGPAELVAALERLHDELGARRFVVPNLPSMGDLPLYGPYGPFAPFGSALPNLLDSLTQASNGALDAALTAFEASHPDAIVTRVDVYSIFKGHLTSPNYPVTNVGCQNALDAATLAAAYAEPFPIEDPQAREVDFSGGPCAPFLYLDIVHPASSAWAPVAQAVADNIEGGNVDRIIAIGDSFSDLGSERDTFLRTVGFAFPTPPFTYGRFTESKNVVQQLEDALGVVTNSTAFAQPLRATESFAADGNATTEGDVFVPKAISGSADNCNAKVKLTFTVPDANKPGKTRKIKCEYRLEGATRFELHRCDHSVSGGDLLREVSNVKVDIQNSVDSASIDWLFY